MWLAFVFCVHILPPAQTIDHKTFNIFCGENGCRTLVSSILITGEANRIAGGPTEPVISELQSPSEGVPVCILPLYHDIDCSSCT